MPNDRKARDQRYEREVRKEDPELLAAKRIRSSAQWQAVRKLRLDRTPLCQDPFGTHGRDKRPVAATEVDHIVSIVQAPSRAFELNNTQALCGACHSRKSGQERQERRASQEGEIPAEKMSVGVVDAQSLSVSSAEEGNESETKSSGGERNSHGENTDSVQA